MNSTTTDDEQSDGEQYLRPSRSARKREAEAAQRLGVRLVELRETELSALQLPEQLLNAIRELRRLKSRSAQARQRQFVGRLMRDVDPAPIERALDARAANPLHRAKVRP
jgi:ribosome-associated protein